MKGIALKEALSSFLNFDFVYDCLKDPALINELVNYE